MTLKSFYPFGLDDEIRLPECHIKAYVDGYCQEYSLTCEETKFIHLGFAVQHGYKLYDEICNFLEDHPEVIEDTIKEKICRFIASLRYSKDKCNKEDEDGMYLVLDEQLNLKDAVDLFNMELNMRFSYEIEGNNIKVSQNYHRWSSLESLVKAFGVEKTRDIITKPTGYKEITEKDLMKENHWPELIKNYNQYDLYSETKEHIYPEDYDIIKNLNEKETNANYKFMTGVPAEPWRGNPLKSKIVILSLNQGYVEEINKTQANTLYPALIEGIWSEKSQTLRFQAEGLLPREQYGYTKKSDIQEKGIRSYGDAINVIDGFYWYDCLYGLNKKLKQDDFEFFQNFSLIQYHAYATHKYKELPSNLILPSQKFTKDLIRYITYNKPDTLFVLMRGEEKWKKLLDEDVWQTLMVKSRLIINKNYRSKQVLSKNMLGEENYQKILDKLNN